MREAACYCFHPPHSRLEAITTPTSIKRTKKKIDEFTDKEIQFYTKPKHNNSGIPPPLLPQIYTCLLYTSDAADEEDSVDLGGRRIIKKKKNRKYQNNKKLENKKNKKNMTHNIEIS
eukprot:TRINITY_DN22885_c0_g1_i3.p1 TRINITY_DN22885_c0_g1~~TRINITY_DN22885_c0_g1_i3.p1  ORF type:complete len:117 (-),score=18.24 TRINITY_DN22885_c0_g1_i3:34-384(-)